MPLLFFGQAREIAGTDEAQWDVLMGERNHHFPSEVGELRKLLVDKFPELGHLSSLAIAVNSQYATDDMPLAEKDEIAIIPPVSGG